MRWLAILLLVVFSTILATACEPEEEEAATPAPTVTPDLESTPPATLVPEVAAVVRAVLSGDQEAVRRLVRLGETGCTTGPVEIFGPPECPPGDPDGTLVDVFLVFGCEGQYVRSDELDETLANLTGRKPKLYGVYPAYPGYKAVFSVEEPEPGLTLGVVLAIEDGEIMFIDFGCGETAEQMAAPLPTASPEPTGTATPSPAASPTLPVPLEEGAPITEAGMYVVDAESGRVWKVSEFATVQWSPDGSALMILGSSIRGGIDLVDIEEGSAVRIVSDGVAATAWSPDGTRIAFSRYVDGPQGLYVVKRDGGDLKQLSEKGAWALQWSPRGDRIAFSDPQDRLYLLEVASGQIIDLGEAASYAFAWSLDGALLAFLNGTGLYIYDPDDDERLQVVDGPSDGPILWSPDGSRIAFRFGPRVALNPATDIRMFHVVEVDGSGEPKPLPPARNPSWSPDGTKMAYLSEGCITGDWDIYTVDLDGGSRLRLTSTPETFKEGPFWSPAGTTIAFRTSDDLMLVDPGSGEVRTLASGGPRSGGPGIHLHYPPWSPDGRYIMFSAGGAHGICD